ncbi:MAG TPA: NAD(P)-dependent oxidoreductase [Selenomonadales bacterium]|nr:NAD(P)-dependent oxidoreductase [Selenomonadales bacterium]
MKILVAGGAGEVGRHLSRHLCKQGHQVTVLDKGESPWPKKGEISFCQGNLADRALVGQAVAGKDAVINLAWSFADDPRELFAGDMVGHINLLEAAATARVNRFIYASTATVYGKPAVSQIGEDCPCRPENARKPFYATAKECAEKICLAFACEKGLPVTIFRFWWAFGGSIGGKHLRDLIRQALDNQPLRMVRGAGGEFVSMTDLAVAMELALTSPRAAGQIYHVGSLFLTWQEIGAMIVELIGSKSELQMVSEAEWSGPAFLNETWRLNSQKIRREIDFEARLDEGEARMEFRRALSGCIREMTNSGK